MPARAIARHRQCAPAAGDRAAAAMGLCRRAARPSFHRHLDRGASAHQALLWARVGRHPAAGGHGALSACAPQHDDYFLILSRLIPYKRIDLAVAAFNELGLPLVIAGDGRDRARLQAMAKSNITFLGRVDDARAAELMAHCRAFIFPGLEDFGIAPVQAQAAGRPVIAFAGGGALDTVRGRRDRPVLPRADAGQAWPRPCASLTTVSSTRPPFASLRCGSIRRCSSAS